MGLDIYFNKTYREEIGYFRKVNFLVGFFDEKYDVQNLSPIEVQREDVEELLSRCNAVLEDHSKAEELLPVTPGFFFGNYEYNEDYFQDVKIVKEYIEKELLKRFDNLGDGEIIEFEIWY